MYIKLSHLELNYFRYKLLVLLHLHLMYIKLSHLEIKYFRYKLLVLLHLHLMCIKLSHLEINYCFITFTFNVHTTYTFRNKLL